MPASYLKGVLLDCIEFLLSVGLIVKVVVADQEADNVDFLKEFYIFTEKTQGHLCDPVF